MPTAHLLRRFRNQEFTATAGQTAFVLSKTIFPVSGLVEMYVNGMAYARGSDFTAGGTTVTWLDNPFTLDDGDCVLVVYDFR